uniref:Uncharacterized protein n=1 Tax=Photinus pyralis TaxID=7054 RepID=A0A1Y1MD17_PHOPY
MVTDESLDLLFSPSKWTKRAVPDVIKLHIDVVTQASKYARKNIPCELNVAYGYAEKEKLDIYGTDLPPGEYTYLLIVATVTYIRILWKYWLPLHWSISWVN